MAPLPDGIDDYLSPEELSQMTSQKQHEIYSISVSGKEHLAVNTSFSLNTEEGKMLKLTLISMLSNEELARFSKRINNALLISIAVASLLTVVM